MCDLKHPIFGDSPDKIYKDSSDEIKCPSNDRPYFSFIAPTGNSVLIIKSVYCVFHP